MPAKPRHRDKIVRTAAMLFRRDGYAATGTNEIVAASGAPKGSLYHYFPGGKAQIARETVVYAGALVSKTLGDLAARHAHPADMVRAYGALLSGWLAKSGFRDGCPITTTLLELSPGSADVTAAGQAVFADWVAVFTASLRTAGARKASAQRLARTAIAAFEGALILARVERSAAPIDDVATEIARLFELSTQPQMALL
jgi:TetR/AcrR family transcriptional repressor of lmrAB and yxaGH operons